MSTEHLVSAWETVDAPSLLVWDLVCDLERYPEWVESTETVLRSDGPARLDATYESRTRLSGFWMATIKWRVVEFDAPTRQVHLGTGSRFVSELRKELEVTPDGERCKFSLTYAYTPVGAIGSVAEFLVSSNVTAEQRRSVRTLAILAEHTHHGDHDDGVD